MARTPDQIAADWAQRLAASSQKIADGVNSVTTSPGQAAAKQADVWASQVAASKAKWQRNVAAVSLAEWQQAMIEKGAPRIASGATASQGKFQNFMTQLLPAIDNAKRGLPPRGTLEQNIARSQAFIRAMAQFQYRK